MTPVQPSVVAVQRHVMLSAVPSSGIVSSMIRITGIGDRDRPEWLIRISGIRSLAIIICALDRFGSPLLIGCIAFASIGPGLIASPFAGALLDRLRAPRAITLDMLVSATA